MYGMHGMHLKHEYEPHVYAHFETKHIFLVTWSAILVQAIQRMRVHGTAVFIAIFSSFDMMRT